MMMESHSKEIWRPTITGGCKDRLSSLPEPILGDILSLLPLKSAIVTSVLSRQWRHLWTQITSFNVIDQNFKYGYFDLLVDYHKLFKQLTSSIVSLEIHLPSSCTYSGLIKVIIDSWFTRVCTRNVERIKVSMQSGWDPPPCVYLTKSLVELDLQCIRSLNFLKMTDLPNLKKLSIGCTHVSSLTLFVKFINSCSSLEDLEFEFCLSDKYLHSDVDIKMPNLKRLSMFCIFFNGLIVIDAPNLEYLSVRGPMKYRFVRVPKTVFVTQLWHCEGDHILNLISQCVRSLQLDRFPLGLQEKFSYLTCLNVDFKPWKFDNLMEFLKFCPVLEVIRLKMNLRYCATGLWRRVTWRLWRLAQYQTNMKKIEIELEKGGWVLMHQTHLVKMVKCLVRSVSKDLKQLTLRATIYNCQATSFSIFGENLVKGLLKVIKVSNYVMDYSNTTYWSFVALFKNS